MISLLVTSRIDDNPNWGLPNLLEGLAEKSANHENFELLVKFDSDDQLVPDFVKTLKKYPFQIKHLVEPRGRGYIDIHIGYTRAMSLADPRSTVMGCFADDFVITAECWDEQVLAETNKFEDDIFIIHQIPHPPFYRPSYKNNPFYMDFDLNHMDTIEVIDEGPFWSRKLLEICGGLGHVSFTDAWTLCLQWFLFHNYGINRTRFTSEPLIHRRLHEDVDTEHSDRWHNDRKWNFEFIDSDFYRTMVKNQARNIALNLAAPLPIDGIPEHRQPARPDLEATLMQTALGAIKHIKHQSALRELEVISKKFPDNIQAHQLLGLLNLFMDQPDSAIPRLRSVLAAAPQTSGIRNQLGIALAVTGKLTEAQALFRDEMSRHPGNSPARENLSRLNKPSLKRTTDFVIT